MTMPTQIDAPQPTARPTVADILGRVSYETGLSRTLIESRDRHGPVVRARAAVVWIAQRLSGASSAQIGRRLGRDHSTILAAATKAEILRGKDPAFLRLTDRIVHDFRDIKEN